MEHLGIYHLQSPEKVQELLKVERYSARWPLTPCDELHAPSVQRPSNPSWRWLLHSMVLSELLMQLVFLMRRQHKVEMRRMSERRLA